MDQWKLRSWSGNLVFTEDVLNSELRAGHVSEDILKCLQLYSLECEVTDLKFTSIVLVQLSVASWEKISSLRRGVCTECEVGFLLSHPEQWERRRMQKIHQRSQAWWRWREDCDQLRKGQIMKSKEMTFKKRKGVSSVKCGREGRHLWTIHIFYFLFDTINCH